MKKIVLTFGFISGGISSLLMAAAMLLQDRIGLGHGDGAYVIGYTTIVLSCLLIFFGVRSYRDNVGGGQITFARGFAVGISIALISCLCYVASWEILYFNFMHDFMDKYSAQMIEKARAAGATAAQLDAKANEAKKMKEMYENPLINAAMTFIEPFPVALVITLISAAVLRKKPQALPVPAS